ncbi:MAG: M14 family zinc carboxypeptidase [Bacteroidales bacterium]|nr:M14 family zinc carboxypeptidase [Bacteroidales bacterium]
MKSNNYRVVITLLFFINFFAFSAYTQNSIEEIFNGRSERYFCFEGQSKDQINMLGSIVSIDRVDGLSVTAVANPAEFENFLKYNIPFQVIPSPNEGFEAYMTDNVIVEEITEWDFYPTYNAYESMMNQFQADYPGLCNIVNIGTLASGRKLLGARVSSNVVNQANKPQFLYSSSMHGDETTGYILSLRLINTLLVEYNTNPRIRRLVDSIDIWIFPLANPDGTYKAVDSTVNGAVRNNANNVDLNRNYPDPRAGQHPDGNAWQPETLAFMALADGQHFTMGANMHGGAEVCNYPWDTWTQLAADDGWWINVCREYADTAHIYSPSSYLTYQNNGITNGAAWYVITGGRQDYMNYFQNCREFTLELSNIKLLPAAQLPALWNYNYRSLLNYMEQALYGLRGKVFDAVTGQPMYAKVVIEGYDNNNSHVFSHPEYGSYFRYLAAATYQVTFSAPCYEPATYTVTIAKRQTTFKTVQLSPLSLQSAFTSSTPSIEIGGTVTFSNASCGNATNWLWTFEGGTPATSTLPNPQVTYHTQGAYDVSLTVGDGTNSHTNTLNNYVLVGLNFQMSNGTVTTCAGSFTDSGGLAGNYQNNENYILTFLPDAPNAMIQVVFTHFDIESHISCIYDRLKIYDGLSTTAPLIGTYCGTQTPGTVIATNTSGALTFHFYSDNTQTKSGWAAIISCKIQGIGVPELSQDQTFRMFPSPLRDGMLILESQNLMKELRVLNLIGQTIHRETVNNQRHQLNLSHLDAGLYLLMIESDRGRLIRKFEIMK